MCLKKYSAVLRWMMIYCSMGNYYEICLSNYHWFLLPHGCPHILRSLKSSVKCLPLLWLAEEKPEPSIGAQLMRKERAGVQVCAVHVSERGRRSREHGEGRRMWPIKIWWSLSDQSRSSNQEATWPLGREETTHYSKLKRCMTLFLKIIPLLYFK